jgi:hypothetical protein
MGKRKLNRYSFSLHKRFQGDKAETYRRNMGVAGTACVSYTQMSTSIDCKWWEIQNKTTFKGVTYTSNRTTSFENRYRESCGVQKLHVDNVAC